MACTDLVPMVFVSMSEVSTTGRNKFKGIIRTMKSSRYKQRKSEGKAGRLPSLRAARRRAALRAVESREKLHEFADIKGSKASRSEILFAVAF